MKHTLKITLTILILFLIAQFISIGVNTVYHPQIKEVIGINGTTSNITIYNLPYGLEPPEENNPQTSVLSIIFAFIIAISLMTLLMKFNAEFFLRFWFFAVIAIALAISAYAFLFHIDFKDATLLSLAISIPFAFWKVYRRNIFVHNITEVFVYPGISAIFVPILSIPSIIFLLLLISVYDMYAVWHSGFMQKMAKYQMKNLKIFSGLFVPYLTKQQRKQLSILREKGTKKTSMKVHVAILGGGDIVFPAILSGVVLNSLGFWPAVIVALGATIALAVLLAYSEKGKFYPAMPFITIGCLIALMIAYLI